MELNLKHPLAFVPTMGALHAGHQSLIELARTYAPHVVVSVFVNPLQFENPDDLAKYPRDIEGDISKAKKAGADVVWTPSVEEIYPDTPTIIPAGAVGKLYEGVHRVGHFDGVLTVVKRLFDLVKPQIAIFGEKDFQQLYLIRSMVESLSLPITIIPAPLIREPDGLAMSSRNVRLSPEDRAASLVISRALFAAARESSLSTQTEALRTILASEPAFTLDYAEIIDESTFQPATESTTKPRALVAGWINGVRLLDNMTMELARA